MVNHRARRERSSSFPEIVCLGELLIDLLGVELTELAGVMTFRRFPGGAAGNVAVGVSRLGRRAGIITRLGTDPFGDFLIATMEEHNVDASGVVRDPARRTGLAFVSLNAQKVPSFTFFRHPSASMYLSPRDLPRKYLEHCRLLYTSSMSLVNQPFRNACREAARRVRKAHGMVAFDVNLRESLWPSRESARREISRFVRLVDILKIDVREFEFLTEQAASDETDWAMLFDRYPNLRLLAVTRGRLGAFLAVSRHVHVHAAPFRIPEEAVVDTTGAGDAFMAALLSQFVQDFEDAEASSVDAERLHMYGEYASAAAAYAVQVAGVIPALPNEADIRRIIRDYPRDTGM